LSAVHKLSNTVGVTVHFEKNIVTDNGLVAWTCMFVGSTRRGILFGVTQSTGRHTRDIIYAVRGEIDREGSAKK
jgi:hypothetical protein